MAETAELEGVDIKSLSLRVGIFGAEPWSEAMRSEIEARLGIVAINVYGLSEVIGPGVSIECTHKQGMHIFEDHFIPEIIDPVTTEPLPDGEMGELVFTCLTKEAMPLIRYRTRDRTRLVRDVCACGRTSVRMDRIVGRTDDMLIVRGVNVFPSQIESVLLTVGETLPIYQIVVDRSADYMDELDVLVEAPTDTFGSPDRLAHLEKRLSYEVQSSLGITCRISLMRPGGIERSEGKAVRVVDKRTLVLPTVRLPDGEDPMTEQRSGAAVPPSIPRDDLAARIDLVKQLLAGTSESYESLESSLTLEHARGKIENFVGAVPIPLGLGGPIEFPANMPTGRSSCRWRRSKARSSRRIHAARA